MEREKNRKLNEELNYYKSQYMQNNNMNNQINISSNNSSNLNYITPGEKIMCVQFKSTDNKIDMAFSCKNTDIFVRLEEKLYEKYPQYKETNNLFTVNGIEVKRFKTIEENKINDSDKIILNN